VTFAASPEAYDRFVGRYSYGLCEALCRAAGVREGARVLDVGAGTGAGTRRLVEGHGEERVAAVEPSETFVRALRERFPAADVRQAAAESLPFPDGSFDAVLAHLVVNFMASPEEGAAEMRRVARPGGTVAACVWDYGEGMTLLRAFWEAAAEVAPASAVAADERTRMAFARAGELAGLWRDAGLADVEEGELVVGASYESFEDLWEPFPSGVGPAGAFAASLDEPGREALRAELRRRLDVPDGPFSLSARAWYAVGTA
jgi:ubiquinone/menaquinone biosynthesis C-methylase UbiE